MTARRSSRAPLQPNPTAVILADLARELGYSSKLRWSYLNEAFVDFAGLPPSKLYAANVEGVWRQVSAEDVLLLIPDHLCVYSI